MVDFRVKYYGNLDFFKALLLKLDTELSSPGDIRTTAPPGTTRDNIFHTRV